MPYLSRQVQVGERFEGTIHSHVETAPPAVYVGFDEELESLMSRRTRRMTDTMDDSQAGESSSGREKYKVAGDKVVSTIKELIHEGNVRHVVIKNEEGRTLIEFPVSIGVAGAVLLPVWAAVGAIAAIVTRCTIEIERESGDTDAVE